MHSFRLAKAITGANSSKDYADMANGKNNTRSYSYEHKPYECGNHNLIKEYSEMLMKKKDGN